LRRSELDLIAAWTDKAKPHRGVYFRSVSYTFMRPETVLDGAGAAAHGGRFVSPGTAAVYLSESDAVATSEVTGRKKRLGGAALINVDKYPRVVFAVGFDLTRVLDLTQRPLPRGMGAIRDKCLGEDLLPSQQFGDVLVAQGIEGLRFPSQAGPGVNLVVYKKCCHPNALKIENEAALRATIAAIAGSIKMFKNPPSS
jgi:RES domain-containing protein